MGAVWLARDEMLLRDVALKELRIRETGVGDSPTTQGLLLSEAQAASQVSHPGVVRVYDVVVEDDGAWIVMEALSGSTLAQVIRRDGPLPVRQVVDIGLQLADALRAVHREGIIHRDVKPSNVQLSPNGRVVLTDFGLASRDPAPPTDHRGYVYGSPPYMAPEALVERRFSPASDLFSLGATLYTAVEGRQPFGELTPFSAVTAEMQDPPHPPVHAAGLRPVIDGLLAKDPDERLGMDEVFRGLKEVEIELVA
jgi:serine/threonine protein kinase